MNNNFNVTTSSGYLTANDDYKFQLPADSTWEVELFKAAAAVEKYVETSYDQHLVLAVMIPPAQALRNQADALEAKDRAIAHFRAVLNGYKFNNKQETK